MPDSHVLHLTFWVNWVLALLAGLFNAVKDNFGLYNPPSAAPVAFTRGGRWGEIVPTPLIGAAAVNLPNGKILIWSAYERFEFSQPDMGDRGRTRTAIMDPLTSSIVEELIVNTDHDMLYVCCTSPLWQSSTHIQSFHNSCPGTAYLPDGRVMITGGTSTPRVTFYDPDADTWTRGNDMILGRGYHSMTLMGGTNHKEKLSSNRSSALFLLTRRCLMFTFTLLISFGGKNHHHNRWLGVYLGRIIHWRHWKQTR
jgi:hypothetical protein